MTTSPILEILALSESQTQKATAINTALSQLEAALADSYTLDTSAAVTAGFDVVIPFDDTNDLTPRTALRFMLLIVGNQATENFNVIHPDNKHMFFCRNSSSHSATVKTAAGSGVTISAGKVGLLYCDGVNITNLEMTAFSPIDYAVNFYGKPNDGQVIAEFLVPRELTLPEGFSGSIGKVGVNPTNDVTNVNVKDDGTYIGRALIRPTGSVEFYTQGVGNKIVQAGSMLTFEMDNPTDPTIEDIHIVLVGNDSNL